MLVDFQSGIDRIDASTRDEFDGRLDDVPGVFDTFILSTGPWHNPFALVGPAYKRLILSHHKDLLLGDFLVEDRPNNGADRFGGRWLPFGSAEFPDWNAVTSYLMGKR